VTRFGRIGIEDLNIKGLAGGMLAKHVHDAAWAQLTARLDPQRARFRRMHCSIICGRVARALLPDSRSRHLAAWDAR